MKKIAKIISCLPTVLGSLSLVGLVASFYVLEKLRPQMIQFQTITAAEESWFNLFGFTLLFLLGFCLTAFFQIFRYLKSAKKITFGDLILSALVILNFFFVFSDVALISDIGKQYRHGLSQPEWLILYPLMTGQFLITLIFILAGSSRLRKPGQREKIAKDSNIFSLAQYVGVVCGLIGLSLISLNFAFPRPLWMIKIHTLITAVFLFIPYGLIVGYWLLIKFQEKTRQWYDEKQIQDIGKSALFTLISSVVIMGLVFSLNFNCLNQSLSVLWFPFYLFLALFLFSLGNLFFERR